MIQVTSYPCPHCATRGIETIVELDYVNITQGCGECETCATLCRDCGAVWDDSEQGHECERMCPDVRLAGLAGQELEE